MIEFDHIISKEKLDEKDEIEDIVNTNSKFETPLLVEKGVLELYQKDCIQLERRGYFYIDKVGDNTATLHYIPDGKSNPMSIVKKKIDPKLLAQGVDVKKSKKQEKKADKEEKKDKKEKKAKEGEVVVEKVTETTTTEKDI
jgi:glutamyl-tRNA synthetase